MVANIDLTGVTAPLSSICTQLRVTLPGGPVIQGVVPQIGASPLQVARATVGGLMSALSPLSPVFSIIDAIMAIVKFAESVPSVVTNPGKVVDAITDVVRKAGKLASMVPQLSVPLLVLGTIDVLLAFFVGLEGELVSIGRLEVKAAEMLGLVDDVPAIGPIHETVTHQIAARKSQISCAIGDAMPLINIVNLFCKLVGLPEVELDIDEGASTTEELAEQLKAVTDALAMVRSKIPL